MGDTAQTVCWRGLLKLSFLSCCVRVGPSNLCVFFMQDLCHLTFAVLSTDAHTLYSPTVLQALAARAALRDGENEVKLLKEENARLYQRLNQVSFNGCVSECVCVCARV